MQLEEDVEELSRRKIELERLTKVTERLYRYVPIAVWR